jgi:hypothetical protein
MEGKFQRMDDGREAAKDGRKEGRLQRIEDNGW